MKVYQMIATALQARENCKESHNIKWLHHWEDILDHISDDILPRGSGIDSGSLIIFPESYNGKVFEIVTSYHHMNENGFYTEWTEHTIKVYPDFITGIDFKITGRDKNDIKDYLFDVFMDILHEEYID